jgi:hypothetical protein
MIEAVNGDEPAYIVIQGVNGEARPFPPFQCHVNSRKIVGSLPKHYEKSSDGMRRDHSTTESTYRASPTANERRANLCPRDSTVAPAP